MAKSFTKVAGPTYKPPHITPNGDAVLLFLVSSEKFHSPIKDSSNLLYRVHVDKRLWKTVSKKVNENTYYVIEGQAKAELTKKGLPIISVLCYSIKTINGLEKDPEGSPDSFVLSGELPSGTDEVIPIESINVPENLTRPKTAIAKAYHYLKLNRSFRMPIKVQRETMTLIDGYAQYLVAKELNISKVPVTYRLSLRGELKDEINIKHIPWYNPDEVKDIAVKDIVLTEDIHFDVKDFVFNLDLKNIHETRKILVPVAVRPIENGKYSLVMGVARYFAAKILDIDTIPAVITDMNHDEFVESRLHLSSKNGHKAKKSLKKVEGETPLALITVPEAFLKTKPRREKIDSTIAYYKKHGKFDKPVIIKGDNNLLVDGYKRYVAAKELNLTTVWTLKLI